MLPMDAARRADSKTPIGSFIGWILSEIRAFDYFQGGSVGVGGYSNPAPPTTTQPPQMSLRIHRHLADQHFFGSPSVNDDNGNMTAGEVSMHADFFHPTWEGRHGVTGGVTGGLGGMHDVNRFDNFGTQSTMSTTSSWGVTGDNADLSIHDRGEDVATVAAAAAAGMENDIGDTVGDREVNQLPERDPNQRAIDNNYRAAVRAFVSWTLANNNNSGDRRRRNSLPNFAGGTRQMLWGAASAASSAAARAAAASSQAMASPAANVHLEVYSSSSANPKCDNDNSSSDSLAGMRQRCTHYQQKLDQLLKSNFDTHSFQECLLDFWDELFPTTCGIHFYNQQSPVPRMSKLHQFLTTPCPKAIGTVQCEIERVRSKSSRGARRVKGRFFPSYEYRLFIRDTKNDNPFQSSRYPPRQDSVLLVAKNKSRKRNAASSGGVGGGNRRRGSGVGGIDFATPAGLASPSNGGASTRRGVTNYYMCLPSQHDVDLHYKSVNRTNASANNLAHGEKSGLCISPLAMGSKHSVEVGRLQSNFIGTEFQIFVPNRVQSAGYGQGEEDNAQRATNALSEQEGAREGDSRVHPIETASQRRSSASRRGSGLVRLARRASLTMSRRGSTSRGSDAGVNAGVEDPASEDTDGSSRRGGGAKKAMRRMSWGATGNSSKKTNRRAIANNSESYYEGNAWRSSSSSAHPTPDAAVVGEVENGAITYTANLLGNRPRIMGVCIPELSADGGVVDEWSGERRDNNAITSLVASSPAGNNATAMLDRFKTIQQEMDALEDNAAAAANNNADAPNHNAVDKHGLMILQNRSPWWNMELGAYVLNFGGRVKVASVKNFQLCERGNDPQENDHLMQFGRIEGRHAFTMDFQWPLTPMQAFAIAISSLQSKISFG